MLLFSYVKISNLQVDPIRLLRGKIFLLAYIGSLLYEVEISQSILNIVVWDISFIKYTNQTNIELVKIYCKTLVSFIGRLCSKFAGKLFSLVRGVRSSLFQVLLVFNVAASGLLQQIIFLQLIFCAKMQSVDPVTPPRRRRTRWSVDSF